MTGPLSQISDIELIERQTLAKLTQLKCQLMALKKMPVQDAYEEVVQRYANELEQMVVSHRQRKQSRDRKRNYHRNTLQGESLAKALDTLKRESQYDSAEYRHLKQKRDRELAPLAEKIFQVEQHIKQLKQQYSTLSQQWQTKKQMAYAIEQTNSQALPLPILYQDQALIVVDKPAGLLSVPGRRYQQYDSVLSRLRYQFPDLDFLQTVHRLDQATSGILVLATSPSAHKIVAQQFAQHRVCKTYQAILSCSIERTVGVIDLPLWGNPEERPKQSVNRQYGKSSTTYFRVLATGQHPRIQFEPCTGRTHQLRVHAAHPQGLNSPILGDLLYGQVQLAERLYLHANSLELTHPLTQRRLQFVSDMPF